MADYYFATTGDDVAGDGSSGNPWETPVKAMAEVAAGDTCHFADGTYTLAATLTISTTGTNGNVITIQATNSGQVTWDVNNAVSAYALSGTSMDYYAFDGIVFEGNETDQTSRVVSLITSDYITFTDCEFKNTQGHCLYADTCDNLTVTDCEIHGEVQHAPPASPLTSEGIYGIQCTNVSVTGTEIYNVSHQGILIYGGSDWTIDDNYIHDTSSHGITIGDSSEATATTTIIVTNNRIDNIGSFRINDDAKFGIYVRHKATTVGVRFNRIWDCDGPGICVLRAAIGDIDIYHNSLTNNNKANVENWGELLLSDTGTNQSPTTNFKNNIVQHEFANRTYAFDANARANLAIDYNVLYDSTGTENILADAAYGTYAAYVAGGWEANSIMSQNPLFADRANDNFGLTGGSPALLVATDLGYGNDIGWWQSIAELRRRRG